MKGFCPLASGSKGNCIYVGSGSTRILLDVGINCKLIESRLHQLHISPFDIQAILITHEHIDHVQGLEIFVKKYKVPVFANSETAKALLPLLKHRPEFKLFTTGEEFCFGDLQIFPFSIQHDTLDPVAFTIKMEELKLGFCTDLGLVTSLTEIYLKECDYLYLEANHHPSMVHSSPRPFSYKQRVLGRQGHLSNEQCAELAASVFHHKLKHIHLAHLSKECNHPELALQIVKERLSREEFYTEISIAYQEKISNPIFF